MWKEKSCWCSATSHPEDDPKSGFDGKRFTTHATFNKKAEQAKKRGAIGLFLVTDPLHTNDESLEPQHGYLLDAKNPDLVKENPFIAGQISQDLARWLIMPTGLEWSEIQRAVDRETYEPTPLQVTATIAVRAVDDTPIEQRNVMGIIPGQELPNEWVVIGAHYDHVGTRAGTGDTIFNGADDNASGTAGLLALAKAFRQSPIPPQRSIVFQAYAAEEHGLYGSEAWLRSRPSHVDLMLMLNLDMIGRNPRKPIRILGDGYATELTPLVVRALAETGVNGEPRGLDYADNSDHHNFHKRKIPSLFFFTGQHEDYHQVTDHADKLSYTRMMAIVRSAHHIVDAVAQGTVTPRFIHRIEWLGVTIQNGIFGDVQPKSPAARAGVKDGDRLWRVGKMGVDPPQAAFLLEDFALGTTSVVVQRGGELNTLDLQRNRTGFLGIRPENPRKGASGVRVGSVVERGPARKAGLRVGDIIEAIDGVSIGVNNLRTTLTWIGAGATVNLKVKRGRKSLTLPITLGESE